MYTTLTLFFKLLAFNKFLVETVHGKDALYWAGPLFNFTKIKSKINWNTCKVITPHHKLFQFPFLFPDKIPQTTQYNNSLNFSLQSPFSTIKLSIFNICLVLIKGMYLLQHLQDHQRYVFMLHLHHFRFQIFHYHFFWVNCVIY